mmetsp:Transcript_14711/g.29027  ORF Transcript_14711/g.29027 Transcript_14711/m.29027 type:complete len:85 (-) Transcript_14711:142-396(-)|eukprot:CAMPEP_0172687766 /NCGR_PEP_ID=MMETSP1074-20121228/21938_1 /TAXON_ID=2916 /ORGANISM="Ceratium fusus, Strain PA161109" /LENGTH=84 /DNA_ID=CAMNT_0013507281 /DNA_START=41 /DNA_END=295 /DNA_ORIENTATION=-
MSQCHVSDSVFCHRHRWKVGLLDLVDEAWMADALPDDDVPLPDGHQINMDEADEKSPDADDKHGEKWSELPLTQFLEEEAESGG